MTSFPTSADLPPEQRQRLHPDFLANERAYAQMRDSLLAAYRGQWVAVRDGQVVAAGDDPLSVIEVTSAAGGHPFIARVGEEDTPFRRTCWASLAE
jgi:Family of unknown function (DUF5678)